MPQDPMLIPLERVVSDAATIPPCPDCCAGIAIRVAELDEPGSEIVWDLVRLHADTCPYAVPVPNEPSDDGRPF